MKQYNHRECVAVAIAYANEVRGLWYAFSAMGRCQVYSARLADRMIGMGLIRARDVGRRWGVHELCFPRSSHLSSIYPQRYRSNHYVLRVEDLMIDLTARQFNSAAPVPLFYKLKQQ